MHLTMRNLTRVTLAVLMYARMETDVRMKHLIESSLTPVIDLENNLGRTPADVGHEPEDKGFWCGSSVQANGAIVSTNEVRPRSPGRICSDQ